MFEEGFAEIEALAAQATAEAPSAAPTQDDAAPPDAGSAPD